MKCYNPHTFEKLGFDVILSNIQGKLISEEAREICMDIRPMNKGTEIVQSLEKVAEFRRVIELEDNFPFDHFPIMQGIFNKLEVEGNYLNTEEIFRLYLWLQTIQKVRGFFRAREEEYPRMHALVSQQNFSKGLVERIKHILDERGNLKDNASPELSRIRKSMSSVAQNLRTLLNKILRKANDNKWSIEKEITLRNDRLVIPIKTDAKGRVPGFVQDISQSGNTVYIEPTESLPLNNHLKELKIGEHNEIIRILQEISAFIRGHLEDLQNFHHIMVEVDFVRAKAMLAIELNGVLPRINPEGKRLRIKKGFYPLLLLKAKESPMEVIPMEAELSPKKRIILISGPNAGGKSVSLKTIGLLQVMLQAGFLIPVDIDSEFRLFDSLFIDLGDEQSVASDLSTYTSHLYQMRQMGDNMNANSLFLIDEFGSGTDPKLGGAIAEAFLERFVTTRSYGVITTHYGNLKDFAAATHGIVNAAMEFDTQGLKPTFRLVEGIPGRSYAFEIAKRVGVHHTVLSKARKKVGQEELNSEQMLRDLERKNAQLSQRLNENKNREKKLEAQLNKYTELAQNLEKNKKKLLRQAQAEAQALIKKANRDIERTIKEIRESQAEKERTKQLRKQLAASAPKITEEKSRPQHQLPRQKTAIPAQSENAPIQILEDQAISQGDWVQLEDTETTAKVVELQGKRAILESGAMRMTVKLKQLVKIKPPQSAKVTSTGHVPNLSMATAKFELDVMGMRVEKALVELDKFLDQARFAGLTSVRILHGKGTGALREAIRKHLYDLSFVKSAKDAPIEMGGAGWTMCELG